MVDGPVVCSHAPGEFMASYDSEVARNAAPQANVVDPMNSILVQYVVYEDIKGEPDPDTRSVAEEAKRQEFETRSGVDYVEYNCLAGAEAMAAPPLADCSECGVNIGRRAARIIGGSEGADGRTAYEIALEAARSTDEDNVALASENEDDGTGGEVIETASTEEEATGDAEAVRNYREEAPEFEEETIVAKSTLRDTEAWTVNDAVTSGEKRVDSPLLALGGGVLLVAGVFLARKVFGE